MGFRMCIKFSSFVFLLAQFQEEHRLYFISLWMLKNYVNLFQTLLVLYLTVIYLILALYWHMNYSYKFINIFHTLARF